MSGSSSKGQWKIYVLQLEEGKYYVGKSQNILERLDAHRRGGATAWTERFPVRDLVYAVETSDPGMDEDNVTIRCMNRHGIENVRGGPYSTLELSPLDIHSIRRRLRHLNDVCQQCGSSEHYINECPNQQFSSMHLS
jgi:GIY-YIG catalytic domain